MANDIGRRQFVTIFGGFVAWAPRATAQQPAMPVIGFVGTGFSGERTRLMAAVHQGLMETGFIEGQNVAIEYYAVESQYDRLPALAAELVRRDVAIIATLAVTPAAAAAKAATSTIPIVFLTAADPVKIGLVSSLSRPGGRNSLLCWRAQWEAARDFAPTGSQCRTDCNSCKPNFSSYRNSGERHSGSGSHDATATRCSGSQQRTRDRRRLRSHDSRGSSRTSCRFGFVFLQPTRSTRCSGGTPCYSIHLYTARICRCQWSHQLCNRSP